MTRECIHGKPFHTCAICKHVKNLLNHNTVVTTKAQMIFIGTRNSNFNRSMNTVRLSQLNDTNATRRVTITPAIRNAANAYITRPSMRTANILREGLIIAITPNNQLLNFHNTGSLYTTPSHVSALNVYGRMGTPGSPTSDRRSRSVTPMSTFRSRSQSNSNSNQNNVLRISVPKRPRKS